MKKLIAIVFCIFLIINTVVAQTPGAFKYQAVVRNNAGQIVVNQNVGFRISILQNSSTGSVVYSEKHVTQTNAFGLVNLEIGKGTTPTGTFSAINWETGIYFVKIELDATNSGTFSEIGTSQLLSVPYALYAVKAGNSFSGSYMDLTNKPVFATVSTSGSYVDLTNKPTLFSGSYTDLTNKPVFATVATSGNFNDLTNKPASLSGDYNDLTNKPVLSTIATTGSYTDLLNQPVLFSGSYTNLTNKPVFAAVATSGSYTDLLNKPNMLATAATPKSGDILYNDGTNWLLLAKGIDGQVLKLENGLPKWKPVADFATVIPTAIFSVSQLLAATSQTITVDASACIDDVDPVTTLQVRWRWADGGTFTAWSTTKTSTNVYTSEGVKNITLEVKDSQGNVGTTSKGIIINNDQFMPLVFTNAASNITTTGATCGGNVVASGGINVTARGVCWSTSENPTITDSKTTDGTGLGIYTSSLTGLTIGTTYYLRAYATNSIATTYGNQVIVPTLSNVVFPTVTTTDATNITANAVTSGGNVTETGGDIVTARGVCWSDHQNPTVADSKTTDGVGTGIFQSQITGLIPGTYYTRAYATNSSGSGYGNMVTFTTEKTLPVLTTKPVTNISAMGAVSGGNITSAGGGTITERGICWSNSPNPTIVNDKTTSPTAISSFSAAIAKASPNTTYYIRSYASNEIGTGYGDQKTFTTSDAAYYTSFETGMTPVDWTGPFTVTNESAFDGSYSFMSLDGVDCDATFTTTLLTAGQLSFYYSIIGYYSLTISIDNVDIANYPWDGNGWRQGLVPISAGTHTIKWHWDAFQGGNKCYIDQIVITK